MVVETWKDDSGLCPSLFKHVIILIELHGVFTLSIKLVILLSQGDTTLDFGLLCLLS